MGGGGWVDQVGLKLTQSPTGVGVGVGTELGKRQKAHLSNGEGLIYSILPGQ